MSTMTVSTPRARQAPPPRPARSDLRRRRVVRATAAGALGMVPWTILLALTLPARHEVHQWRLTWAGFDVLLIAALAGTALLGRRRHPAAIVAVLLTAVLLICDAWFDVSLALGTPAVWWSAALAVFVELPLAAFLLRKVLGMMSLAQWPRPR